METNMEIKQFLEAYLAADNWPKRPDDFTIESVEQIDGGYRIKYSWYTRSGSVGESEIEVSTLDLLAFAWRGVQP